MCLRTIWYSLALNQNMKRLKKVPEDPNSKTSLALFCQPKSEFSPVGDSLSLLNDTLHHCF